MSAAGRSWLWLAAPPVLAVLPACDDPLIIPHNIVDNRVLAARVEVVGEPERARPRPGESASVRWLVADRADPRPIGWHFRACVARPSMRGVPRCGSPPFAGATQPTPEIGIPTIDIEVPDDAALEGASRLVMLGVVCADGTPATSRPWPDWSCDGAGAQTTLASFEVFVERAGETNLNPSLTDDLVTLDGAEWTTPDDRLAPAPTPTPSWGCASEPPSGSLPRVRADGVDHQVAIVFAGDDRESLRAESSLAPQRESLYVAHLSTAGELERQFTVIESFDPSPAPRAEVLWTAPTDADPAGYRARFYLIVRDDRGGVDWTRREMCLVP